ncbi:MAG: LVIVD repeat-containing protein [Anaerolineae bacterium]
MRRRLLPIVTVIPLMACGVCPLLEPGAIPTGEIELVGHLGGVANAVAAQGSYVYAGFGSELAILDISDPVSPERVGYIVLPGLVEDLVVAGRYAYVSLTPNALFTDARLLVVDVSDPHAPFEVPEMAMEGKNITIVPSDPPGPTYAYVGLWNKLKVMDISDRDIPDEIGSYDLLGMLTMDVIVIDAYAYVLWGYWYRSGSMGGMKVLDATDPAVLREVGTIYGPAPPAFTGDDVAFAAVDGGLYIGTYRDGVDIVDISNPTNPVHVGYTGYGEAKVVDIVVADDLAYAVYDDGTLSILDISDPIHPFELVASRVLPEGVMDIAVEGDYIYAAGGDEGGLHVVDVSSPVAPVIAGSCIAPGKAERFAVADGRAYLISPKGYLWIVDVLNPQAPSPTGHYRLWNKERFLRDMTVIDGYIFYATTEAGLQVAAVPDPATPKETWPGMVNAMAQAGDPSGPPYLYVTTVDDSSGDGGAEILRILDVSSPYSPRQVGQVDIVDPEWQWSHIQDMFVTDDGYAYAAGVRGLWIVDVSDAANATVVAHQKTQGAAQTFVVAKGYAYIADGLSGLRVLDVSDPTEPVDIGHVGIAGLTVDVAVGNGCVYVVNEQEGLWVWNISDPANPTNPRNFYIPGSPVQVIVADDLVYVLDATGGLYILQVEE